MENQYYDGTKLLSLKDINGNVPEVFLCSTNRSGGKTTYFNRLCVNKFIQKKEKFCLVYRFNYELDNVADKFFKDIQGLFFPQYHMVSERKSDGVYHELKIGKLGEEYESCGYAVALNSADQIKKNSHFFSDVERMLFDEFQSETNHYCSDEVAKLMSIHTSIARGQGKQVRYVPVYMISNPITILNPYYVVMGITDRLNTETKFLRGDGFVLEIGFIESASKQQQESAFNRAFQNDPYATYVAQGVYLNDNLAFLENPQGKSRYICTVKYKGTNFAIREYSDLGIIYCDNRPDLTNPNKISITTEDHNINYVMLKTNQLFITNLRYYFDHGCFRFKDLRSKEAILKMLSY